MYCWELSIHPVERSETHLRRRFNDRSRKRIKIHGAVDAISKAELLTAWFVSNLLGKKTHLPRDCKHAIGTISNENRRRRWPEENFCGYYMIHLNLIGMVQQHHDTVLQIRHIKWLTRKVSNLVKSAKQWTILTRRSILVIWSAFLVLDFETCSSSQIRIFATHFDLQTAYHRSL